MIDPEVNYGDNDDNDDSRQLPSPNRKVWQTPPIASPSETRHDTGDISLPMHNPADTSGSSPPASPATPFGDPSTRLSAMQTVQTYLTQETQAIQTHLTTVLPGLIQKEVHTQCSHLAQEISGQISSLRKEVLRPTGDQDDPMSSSIEEGENEDSSGRGKRSARHSRDKGKGGARRFAMEGDNANNGDEADEEDEGGENESDDEMSVGRRKYKKQKKALRVSIHSCSP
jgi:hypothetical protein